MPVFMTGPGVYILRMDDNNMNYTELVVEGMGRNTRTWLVEQLVVALLRFRVTPAVLNVSGIVEQPLSWDLTSDFFEEMRTLLLMPGILELAALILLRQLGAPAEQIKYSVYDAFQYLFNLAIARRQRLATKLRKSLSLSAFRSYVIRNVREPRALEKQVSLLTSELV